MPESFPIDLDSEKVLFDGTWYRKEDLARKIKAMVDGGDFKVTRPSSALELLEAALGTLRSVTLKLPAELADGLAAAASRVGKSLDAFAREALARSIGAAVPQAHAAPLAAASAPAPVPLSLGSAAAPIPLVAAAASAPVATAAASPEEAASAIALTPKKAPAPAGGDAEKGWFDRR